MPKSDTFQFLSWEKKEQLGALRIENLVFTAPLWSTTKHWLNIILLCLDNQINAQDQRAFKETKQGAFYFMHNFIEISDLDFLKSLTISHY